MDSLHDLHLDWQVRIPMRDGVRLAAKVYRPKGAPPGPALLTMTPYGLDLEHPDAFYLARRGYAVVVVDCRGRGDSEGVFIPDVVDIEDGPQVLAWVAAQPWCDGRVGMYGGSYSGQNQWVTLRAGRPELRTIVPAKAPLLSHDYVFRGPIKWAHIWFWDILTSGRDTNFAIYYEKAYFAQKLHRWYKDCAAFSELYRYLDIELDAPNARAMAARPTHHTAGWALHDFTPEQYAAIRVPILTLAGAYDDSQRGSLYSYRQHLRYGNPEAVRKHYVVVGPWDHAALSNPRRQIGGLTFGEASLVNLRQLHLDWFNWVFKGGPRPELLQKNAAYYLMGAEEWRHAERLETVADERRVLYLDSDGRACDVFASGRLQPELPSGAPADTFIYDPLDTRYGDLELEVGEVQYTNALVEDWITDQRWALNLFGAGLVYHSEPFAHDTELTGWMRLVVYLSLDVPDTDFEAIVSEITADGRHIRLTADEMRLRYREGRHREVLAEPGRIYRLEFDGFTFFSRRIARGSRLRLVFKSPNSVFTIKNYNAGGVVENESGQDARTAHITLYHSPEYPSFLEIPVVRRGAG
ncbi:MAG: CocE/NonD family hydrolase [Meiothermus sp.]|nr:CocE/NonD family hydrolase [Meiothermus sp.]